MNEVALTPPRFMTAFEKRKPLTKGQRSLLDLINEKTASGEVINMKECSKIYLKDVQRSTYTNDQTYNHETKDWVMYRRKRVDYEIENSIIQWTVYALGALVKKGYVAIMPMIDFTKTKE